MEKRNISFDLIIYQSREELPTAQRDLLEIADESRKNAYAPYSKFQVGAAVLLENGKVVIGNNQENASYPSGLCAERVAVFQAGASFPGVPINAIAIVASSSHKQTTSPAAPCGNCRQSIAEYELKQNSPIQIIMSGVSGPVYISKSIANLLPLAFGNTYL